MADNKKNPVPKKKRAVESGLASVLDGPTTPVESSKPKTTTKKPVRAKKPAKVKKASVAAGAAKKSDSGPKKKVPGSAPAGSTKVTYYIEDALLEGMRKVGEALRRKPSSMVNEAIEDFVKRHAKGKNTTRK